MIPGIPFDRRLIGKTYLITGASGFIGGRIVERICRDYKGKVKALVHNLGHAARIARFDIEILSGNILDRRLLIEATKNVDYVIHCAFGNTSDTALNHRITVEGTRNILDASLKKRVKRFIHFSTMSVYGSPLPNHCNENTHYQAVKGDFYNNDKIEAEEIVEKYHRKGLPTVVLQPTIVYGPYASLWTVWLVNQIKQNKLVLTDHGLGLANPVYIDNVVDAVLLALISGKAVGERLIISDGKTVSWKEFFSYYQRMTKSEPIKELSRSLKYKYLLLTSVVDTLKRFKKKIYPAPLFKGQNTFTRSFDAISQKTDGMKSLLSDTNLQNLFKERCVFDISKAREKLDYAPRISLAEGMRLTKLWLKYARLIN